MKKRSLITIFIFIGLVCFFIIYSFIYAFDPNYDKAQIKSASKDSINIYVINNESFVAIIDSFITHEKQYKYFSNNLTFYMNILDSNGTCIQLSSGSITDTLYIMDYDDVENCGVFYYKTFRFLINGRSIVDKRILKRENKKVIVKRVRLSDDDNVIEDDSYFPTTWIYKFKNDKFYSTYKSDMKDNRNK